MGPEWTPSGGTAGARRESGRSPPPPPAASGRRRRTSHPTASVMRRVTTSTCPRRVSGQRLGLVHHIGICPPVVASAPAPAPPPEEARGGSGRMWRPASRKLSGGAAGPRGDGLRSSSSSRAQRLSLLPVEGVVGGGWPPWILPHIRPRKSSPSRSATSGGIPRRSPRMWTALEGVPRAHRVHRLPLGRRWDSTKPFPLHHLTAPMRPGSPPAAARPVPSGQRAACSSTAPALPPPARGPGGASSPSFIRTQVARATDPPPTFVASNQGARSIDVQIGTCRPSAPAASQGGPGCVSPLRASVPW